MPRITVKNSPIGSVPCWHRGCEATALVFRFAERAQADGRRRKAGKLYAKCAVHGAYGLDACEASQEYILEHGTIDGAPPVPAAIQAARPAPAPASAPEPAPQAAPAPAPERSRGSGWGFF